MHATSHRQRICRPLGRVAARAALTALAALAAGLVAGTANADVLIVVTERGVSPAVAAAAPGELVIWLNRSRQASVALTFDAPAPGAPRAAPGTARCPGASGFHEASSIGPFTGLLPPTAVVARCAPAEPGAHAYRVTGDLRATATLEVGAGGPP